MPQENSPGQGSRKNDFASQIRDAETSISRRRDAALSAERAPRPRLSLKVPAYLIIILLSTIAIRLNSPELMAASIMKKPLRSGSYLTDRKTDLCISNLWAITSALRANLPAPVLTCPVSSEPYQIFVDSASCPNPKLHEAIALHGNKTSVIPTLEK
jgi:hypothetical protein